MSTWTVSQASSDGKISRPSILDRALMTKSNLMDAYNNKPADPHTIMSLELRK